VAGLGGKQTFQRMHQIKIAASQPAGLPPQQPLARLESPLSFHAAAVKGDGGSCNTRPLQFGQGKGVDQNPTLQVGKLLPRLVQTPVGDPEEQNKHTCAEAQVNQQCRPTNCRQRPADRY
jgi:hypothetical protein